mgnify:CR=1 FL=1
MFTKQRSIQSIYFYLILGNTLAVSFIWGIDTIFLLSAGLTNFQAFSVNAFFTLGQVLFEVPTGIIADKYGRRTSYLFGCLTLAISTGLYIFMWQIKGPFWGWAISSALLGLGYTFFSGALEAWLVDALKFTKFKGKLEDVFSKGQIVGGVAMLIGSICGGLIAQYSNISIPYYLRSAILFLNFLTAFMLMKDLGFNPIKTKSALNDIKKIFNTSLHYGFKNPPVRWIMLSSPFITGVSFYIFYALQPFLLKLYGDEKAYGIAGIAAALIASSRIFGGFITSFIRKLFKKRTDALLSGIFISGLVLILVGMASNFWLVLILIFIWGLIFAAISPIRQTLLNNLIPSSQRATVLSFDSLVGSSGGIFIQPILGRSADLWSYSTSYLFSSLFQLAALPFMYLAKKQNSKSDIIK